MRIAQPGSSSKFRLYPFVGVDPHKKKHVAAAITEDLIVRFQESASNRYWRMLGPLKSYQNSKQLVKMAGTNPIEAESGGKRLGKLLSSPILAPQATVQRHQQGVPLHRGGYHYGNGKRQRHKRQVHQERDPEN